MFFLFLHFPPKLFCFPCIRLMISLRASSTYLQVEFSFVILKCPALSVLFDPVSVSFLSSFFRSYLPIYILKLYCYFYLCCFSLFNPKYFLCCRRFSICISSLISNHGFKFLYVFFTGTPILSRTNRASALISFLIPCCYVLRYLWTICLFFSVSTLTVIYTWFLRDAYAVLF